MLNETVLEPLPPGPHATFIPGVLITPATQVRAGVCWGQQLARLGRGCLVVFAAVALINANRQAGLLTWGALAQVSSAVRGSVPVGVAYLLLPMGVALWFLNPFADVHMAKGLAERVIALVALCSAGGAVYALAIFGFGAYRLSELKALFVRPKKAA